MARGWTLGCVFQRKSVHPANQKFIRCMWFPYQGKAHIGSKANVWKVNLWKGSSTHQKMFEVEDHSHAEVFCYYANIGHMASWFLFPLVLILYVFEVLKVLPKKYVMKRKRSNNDPKIMYVSFWQGEHVIFSENLSLSQPILKKTRRAVKHANLGYGLVCLFQFMSVMLGLGAIGLFLLYVV